MSSTPVTDTTKPNVLYRAGNIALDVVTLGVFTARYKNGWPNAWRADGSLPASVHTQGTNQPRDRAGPVPGQQQQQQ